MSITKSIIQDALESLRQVGYAEYVKNPDGSFSVYQTPEGEEAMLMTMSICPEEVIPLTVAASVFGPDFVKKYLERRLNEKAEN